MSNRSHNDEPEGITIAVPEQAASNSSGEHDPERAMLDAPMEDGEISTMISSRAPHANCCQRLWADLNPFQSWFYVYDPATGRQIDVVRSFAPQTCAAILWKLLVSTIAVSMLLWNVAHVNSFKTWPYYFANWGLLFTTVYLVMSFINTVMASCTSQPSKKANSRIAFTWVLFSLAATWGGIQAILYWLFDFDFSSNRLFADSDDFQSFMESVHVFVLHGPLTLVCWWDGIFVNRIPLRWSHYVGLVLPLQCLFVVYIMLMAYGFGPIGGGEDGGWDFLGQLPDRDNLQYVVWAFVDYDNLDDDETHGNDWVKSAVAVAGFGILQYLLLWMASQYTLPCCCACEKRMYVDGM